MNGDFSVIERVEDVVKSATVELFPRDLRIQAIGIGWSPERGYGLRITRNLSAPTPRDEIGEYYEGVPVYYGEARSKIVPYLEVLSEQLWHRDLACGIQIQNYNDDLREGRLARLTINVGTLGCFVRRNGSVFLLSCNHVIAGNNKGLRGSDRIFSPGVHDLSPGVHDLDKANHVATLSDYCDLVGSDPMAGRNQKLVNYNKVDAAVAELTQGFRQAGGGLSQDSHKVNSTISR